MELCGFIFTLKNKKMKKIVYVSHLWQYVLADEDHYQLLGYLKQIV